MAIGGRFVFSDPLLQREVVSASQIEAARDAARAQQFSEAMRAIRADRQLNADREERRAERDRVIREGEARTAENRRQFDITTGLTREDIKSREKIAGVRGKEVDDRDLYAALLKLVEGDDPPTLKELEARMVDLPDTKKQILRDRRNSVAALKLKNFNASRAEAQRLRGLIGTVVNGKTLTADDVLRGSQWKNVLQITPDGSGFESLLTPPREDPLDVPATPTFHVPIGRPPSDIGLTPERINDILRRRSGTPGFAFSMGEIQGARPTGPALPTGGNAAVAYGLPFVPSPQEFAPRQSMSISLPNIMRGGMGGAGFYVPPPQPPQVIAQPSPGFYPRDTDFRVPVQYPGAPGYGARSDGSLKGLGYFGELQRPDRGVSTELSIGVNFDGQEREIPSLVPTLTKGEVDYLLSGGRPTDAIVEKAVAHARQRLSEGRSPFAQPGEQATGFVAPSPEDPLAPPVFVPQY